MTAIKTQYSLSILSKFVIYFAYSDDSITFHIEKIFFFFFIQPWKTCLTWIKLQLSWVTWQMLDISSAESQKGFSAVQWCSTENQNGAITKDFVQR